MRRLAGWRPVTAVGAVVCALVAGQVVAALVILAAGGRDAAPWAVAVGSLLFDAAMLAVVWAFAHRGAERLGPATFSIRRTRFWPAVGWMLAIYAGVSALEAGWAALVGGGRSSAPHGGGGTGMALLVVLAVAVVAPIVEEVVFRGFLFPALSRWRGPWVGAVLTALLFGAAHVATYPPQLLPLMVLFGFGACLLLWFTGSLLPCVALHALNNSIVVAVASAWTWQAPLAVGGAVLAAVLLLWPLARGQAARPARAVATAPAA